MPSIEKTIIQAQLRWTGHVARMNEIRLPKRILYGELALGKRSRGHPKARKLMSKLITGKSSLLIETFSAIQSKQVLEILNPPGFKEHS